MDAEYITYHNTYNDVKAWNEVNYMIGNSSQVSYHYAVDEKEVVQGIRTDRNAWACGDGGSGTGNRKSISVEVCYSKNGGSKYDKAEKLANKFIAQLLHERGWGVDRVKPHQYWSGKWCPHRILSHARWSAIIEDIQSELDALRGEKEVSEKPAPLATRGYLYRGDKGSEVKELQEMLNNAGAKPKLKVDGSFGSKTEDAVKDFQNANGLKPDGIAGQNTHRVLEIVNQPKREFVSIVDYLSHKGMDTSFSNRSKLAKQYGIKSYKGTAKQNIALLDKMLNDAPKKTSKPKSEPKPKGNMETNSIVEYLQSVGESTSFKHRSDLADKFGVRNYKGTAGQNLELLEKLRGGKAPSKPKPKVEKSGIKTIGSIRIENVRNSAIIMDKPNRNTAKRLGTISKGSTIKIAGSVRGKNNPDGYWEVVYKNERAYISGQLGRMI